VQRRPFSLQHATRPRGRSDAAGVSEGEAPPQHGEADRDSLQSARSSDLCRWRVQRRPAPRQHPPHPGRKARPHRLRTG
ncbi:unnamed protein product, partial [Ectocarpus fasciculatus]